MERRPEIDVVKQYVIIQENRFRSSKFIRYRGMVSKIKTTNHCCCGKTV